jgi:hypothetical protein
VLVLLGGGYTKAEQTLARQGTPGARAGVPPGRPRHARGRDARGPRASLGRRVDVVMTAANHDPDVMAVVFMLEPLGGSGSAGRWGAGEEPVPPALSEDGAPPT